MKIALSDSGFARRLTSPSGITKSMENRGVNRVYYMVFKHKDLTLNFDRKNFFDTERLVNFTDCTGNYKRLTVSRKPESGVAMLATFNDLGNALEFFDSHYKHMTIKHIDIAGSLICVCHLGYDLVEFYEDDQGRITEGRVIGYSEPVDARTDRRIIRKLQGE